MNNYNNAFTEVYTILEYLDEEELNKISPEVLETIRANRNIEYVYEIDDDLELKQNPMLPETKAILFNLFRDYLATPEQKEKIIKMQREERKRNELKKQQTYNTNVFANNQKEEKKNEVSERLEKENLEIIEYKENIFKKILNYIKQFFSMFK